MDNSDMFVLGDCSRSRHSSRERRSSSRDSLTEESIALVPRKAGDALAGSRLHDERACDDSILSNNRKVTSNGAVSNGTTASVSASSKIADQGATHDELASNGIANDHVTSHGFTTNKTSSGVNPSLDTSQNGTLEQTQLKAVKHPAVYPQFGRAKLFQRIPSQSSPVSRMVSGSLCGLHERIYFDPEAVRLPVDLII